MVSCNRHFLTQKCQAEGTLKKKKHRYDVELARSVTQRKKITFFFFLLVFLPLLSLYLSKPLVISLICFLLLFVCLFFIFHSHLERTGSGILLYY